MKVEPDWDDDTWEQVIARVRAWNDQVLATLKEDRQHMCPEHADSEIDHIMMVASGFMEPQDERASCEDAVAWLAVQAAILIVEKLR